MPTFELSGSVTDKERGFIETWENVSHQVNYIVRENRRGDEEYIEVSGPKKFKLSTYDRMLTEDKIVNPRLNPFKNGSFRPIMVPEDISIESNPNALSAEDIRNLFGASEMAWDEYMQVIDSPATLQRMVDMADRGDAELSHRRYLQLTQMLDRFSNINKQVAPQKDAELIASVGSGSEQVSASRRGRAARSA